MIPTLDKPNSDEYRFINPNNSRQSFLPYLADCLDKGSHMSFRIYAKHGIGATDNYLFEAEDVSAERSGGMTFQEEFEMAANQGLRCYERDDDNVDPKDTTMVIICSDLTVASYKYDIVRPKSDILIDSGLLDSSHPIKMKYWIDGSDYKVQYVKRPRQIHSNHIKERINIEIYDGWSSIVFIRSYSAMYKSTLLRHGFVDRFKDHYIDARI